MILTIIYSYSGEHFNLYKNICLKKKKNATEIKDNKRALDRTMKRRGLDPGDNENLRGSRVLLFSVV